MSDDQTEQIRKCESKRSLASRPEAAAVAALDWREYRVRLHAYRCRLCGLWHLSRQRPWDDD